MSQTLSYHHYIILTTIQAAADLPVCVQTEAFKYHYHFAAELTNTKNTIKLPLRENSIVMKKGNQSTANVFDYLMIT